MRPKLEIIIDGENYFLKITPTVPGFSAKVKEIPVTIEEVERIANWKAMGTMIQDELPHWSADKRELLMTGMDDEEFNMYVG